MIHNNANLHYRGFQLGYIVGLHGYLAAWKSSLEDKWTEGHIYVDDLEDCFVLAQECIDWYYKEHTLEVQLGRKLTMEEIMSLRG